MTQIHNKPDYYLLKRVNLSPTRRLLADALEPSLKTVMHIDEFDVIDFTLCDMRASDINH